VGSRLQGLSGVGRCLHELAGKGHASCTSTVSLLTSNRCLFCTLCLQLANTEEYVDGNCTGNLGEVLIRCNNVLYIRGVDEEEEDGEMRE
jgi:hypothetical protein